MQSEIQAMMALVNNVAVIIVIAYFLTRSKLYNRVLDNTLTWKDKLLLILIFGIFSIYGTLGGVKIMGGIAGIRDLGPTIAGMMAGPLAGMAAGLIGGIHRYTQGGFTAIPCTIAPVVAGLMGGVAFLCNRRRLLSLPATMLLMMCVELMHMGLTVAISRPLDQAIALVQSVIIPMVVANVIAIVIYRFFVANLLKERRLAKAKQLIEGELSVARDIQMSLVPKTFPLMPARKEFSLYATLEPAKEVGGDLYDFYFVGPDRLFFLIGDVSGKGIPAALFMAVTRTVIKANIQSSSEDLGIIMSKVNNALVEGNENCMFVTVFCGFLDFITGKVTFINAGHNPPALIKADGTVGFLTIQPNVPLGVMEDVQFQEEQLFLEPGDTLYLYTDGVTEATNKAKTLFTEEAVLEVLKGANHLTMQQIVEKTLDAVHHFAAGSDPADDITILALRMERFK